MAIDKTLYDRLGGKPISVKVHKVFYDKAYAHPWLSKFFTDKPQQVLEDQQTDFMIQLMGGPKQYGGKTPKSGINDNLRKEWLNADLALKKSLIKLSADECQKAYPTQAILDFKQ